MARFQALISHIALAFVTGGFGVTAQMTRKFGNCRSYRYHVILGSLSGDWTRCRAIVSRYDLSSL
jgi:hypothetical protein